MDVFVTERTKLVADIPTQLFTDLSEAFDRRGVSNRTDALRRLFAWFLEQPPTIQAAILGTLPEDLPVGDVARILLERMATDDPDIAGKVPKSPGRATESRAT
tara:strand:- start:662 stop:970 length:309 start_codon:yes stop_codon:yes gene_type:complete